MGFDMTFFLQLMIVIGFYALGRMSGKKGDKAVPKLMRFAIIGGMIVLPLSYLYAPSSRYIFSTLAALFLFLGWRNRPLMEGIGNRTSSSCLHCGGPIRRAMVICPSCGKKQRLKNQELRGFKLILSCGAVILLVLLYGIVPCFLFGRAYVVWGILVSGCCITWGFEDLLNPDGKDRGHFEEYWDVVVGSFCSGIGSFLGMIFNSPLAGALGGVFGGFLGFVLVTGKGGLIAGLKRVLGISLGGGLGIVLGYFLGGHSEFVLWRNTGFYFWHTHYNSLGDFFAGAGGVLGVVSWVLLMIYSAYGNAWKGRTGKFFSRFFEFLFESIFPSIFLGFIGFGLGYALGSVLGVILEIVSGGIMGATLGSIIGLFFGSYLGNFLAGSTRPQIPYTGGFVGGESDGAFGGGASGGGGAGGVW